MGTIDRLIWEFLFPELLITPLQEGFLLFTNYPVARAEASRPVSETGLQPTKDLNPSKDTEADIYPYMDVRICNGVGWEEKAGTIHLSVSCPKASGLHPQQACVLTPRAACGRS